MDKKRIMLVSSIAAALVLISVISAILFRRDKGPDLTGKSPGQIKAYFQSDAFQNMNPKDQRAIKKKVYGPMKQKQQETFVEQAKTYSGLPPQQKTQFLDKMINEYVHTAEKKQQRTQQKNASVLLKQDSETKGGRSNVDKTIAAGKKSATEFIRTWSEKVTPEQRAYILELKEAMIRRMDERGIDL